MPTWTAVPDSTTKPPVIRAERYRVCFDSLQQAALYTQIAETCHDVWNYMLADRQRRYALWRDYKIGPKLFVSFFTLGKRFTVLRNDPAHV
ncbi:MAG: helix-turn-helix domain-containing protein [Caldilineaceae bacterium]|nr:helix-turn-helix domain-containing protein [Caldilineaceae bacterium]